MSRARGANFANPLVIWVAAWSTILLLTSLRLTTQLLPLNRATVILVVANMMTFALIFIPLSLYFRGQGPVTVPRVAHGEFELLRRTVRRLLVLWGAGTAVEMVVFGGLPLFLVLAGDYAKSYQAFGFPTFHGLLQSLSMFCLAGSFIEWLVNRNRGSLLIVAGLCVWPLLLVNRGMFVWSVLELAAIYLILRRVRWRDVAKVAAAALVVILIIGWIGDARAAVGAAALQGVVSERAEPLFDVLPSGFMWLYVYATSPINNVVAAIEGVRPVYSFFYSSVPVIPTVLREVIFSFRGDERYALGLVASEFNTSTIYVNYLADWGVAGAIVVVGLLQACVTYFYLAARRGYVWGLLGFPVFFVGVVLSGFTDTFAYLPGIAQVLLALYFKAISHRSRLTRTFRDLAAPSEAFSPHRAIS